MKMKQKDIAKKVGISQSYVCEIINRNRRPAWPVAKRLAEATGTSPVLWLEGTTEQIRQVLAGDIEDPYFLPGRLPSADGECRDQV